LLNQLSLAGLSPEEHQIGELIIGSINDDGYLTTPSTNWFIQPGLKPGSCGTCWR
jgi:DNA-directed RNA polymerase specialized sigma54-like protein